MCARRRSHAIFPVFACTLNECSAFNAVIRLLLLFVVKGVHVVQGYFIMLSPHDRLLTSCVD